MRRPLDCPEVARIYTKTGDDGTTGLLFGGRVRKDAAVIEANGAIDEAQAFLGLARAEAGPDTEIEVVAKKMELIVRHKVVCCVVGKPTVLDNLTTEWPKLWTPVAGS